MKKWMCFLLLTTVLCTTSVAQANEANPVLEKAIRALGGAKKLEKLKSLSWKATSTAPPFSGSGGAPHYATIRVTVQWPKFAKQEIEGEFAGEKVRHVMIIAGEKVWRGSGNNNVTLSDIYVDEVKAELWFEVLPITLLELRAKEFKLETLPEEKLGEKWATVLKVTPPKGKDFKIYFDKESGLPVRLVVVRVGNEGRFEIPQDMTFSDYKKLSGINKATKITIRRGSLIQILELTEFMASEKEADPKMFIPSEGVKQ